MRVHALLGSLVLLAALAQAKEKPRPCVRWAKSWEAAIDEARALNLPLVIHRHGFYWSPCKAVHQGVLQNKAYIRFADKNTVEVICMQDLGRALAEKNPQVKTYSAKDRYGDDVAYLLKFPGLTIDELDALAESDALQYMEGRLMPATVILDPHTLEKMGGIMRGVRRAPEFIAAITPHVKALKAKYGPGIERKLWDGVSDTQVEVDRLLADEKIADAMAVYREMAKRCVRQPEALKRRLAATLEIILEDAGKRLDALEQRLGGEGRDAARREIGRLARALRDTPLEERALALTKKS